MLFPLTLPLLAGLALLAAPAPRPAGLARTLRAAHWRQRVVLLGAPTAGQAAFRRQRELLAAVPDQLRERDLLVLEVPYDQLAPADRQYWVRELKQSLTHFSVVLIGKDGGVKRTEIQPLSPASLFATIDQMPMRQQEAKRQNK